ncbi:RNA-binding, nab2-type zinc finger domain-containing protein [Ditylenchus destructor]|nr:RNA-binding, nab2-type zinc finger domain-containing protein [Ditylenchus destructor]
MATQSASSTEFTRKLRAAVKAKLEEFGLEVDEELPDYVMIMVGNKKDPSRMKQELKLFLGENTLPFVDWLFGFFQKIKTVSIVKDDAEKKVKDEKKVKSEHTTSEHKNHDSKKTKEKAVKKEAAANAKHEPHKSSDNHSHNKKSSEARARIIAPPDEEKSKIKVMKKSNNKSKETEKPKAKESHSRKREQSNRKCADEYATSSENDDRGFEDERHRHKSIKPTSKGYANEMSPEPVKKRYKSSESYKVPAKREFERVKSPIQIKRDRIRESSPIETPPRKERASHRELSQERSHSRNSRRDDGYSRNRSDDDYSLSPPRKAVRSQVVVQKSQRILSPPKPKLSSKVVVMRRNEDQESARGHSTLFKRAISDAASDLHHRPPSRNLELREKRDVRLDYEDDEDDIVDNEKHDLKETSSKAQTNTRIIITVNRELNTRSNVTIKDDTEEEIRKKQIKKETDDEEEVDGSEVQEETNEKQAQVKAESTSKVRHAKTAEERAKDLVDIVSQYRRKRKADNLARAFLKLSGINPKVARYLQETGDLSEGDQKATAISTGAQSATTNVCQCCDASINECTKKPSQTVQVSAKSLNPQTVKKSPKKEHKSPRKVSAEHEDSLHSIKRTILNFGKDSPDGSSPRTPITPIWDGQINLDDFSSSDDDDEAQIDALLATAQVVRSGTTIEPTEQIPPTAVLSRPSLYRSGSSSSYSTLGYNPTQYQPAFVPPVRIGPEGNRATERCRFWPDCRNEDVCPFYHPSKPCANFPNCWYGEKCLFIHPRCRFSPNCTKSNCPFAHTKLTKNATSAVTTLSSTSAISTAVPQPVSADPSSSTVQTTPSESDKTAAESLDTIKSAANVNPVVPVADVPLSALIASKPPQSNIPCRYAGKCQNANCVFKHPPPCRFGLNCMNTNCYFLHRRADPNRYKWVAPSLSTA